MFLLIDVRNAHILYRLYVLMIKSQGAKLREETPHLM
jgi:hypothetical protein